MSQTNFLQIEIAYVNDGIESIRTECIIPMTTGSTYSFPLEFNFFHMLCKSLDVAQFTVSSNGKILMPKDFKYDANEKWVGEITYISDYLLRHPEELN